MTLCAAFDGRGVSYSKPAANESVLQQCRQHPISRPLWSFKQQLVCFLVSAGAQKNAAPLCFCAPRDSLDCPNGQASLQHAAMHQELHTAWEQASALCLSNIAFARDHAQVCQLAKVAACTYGTLPHRPIDQLPAWCDSLQIWHSPPSALSDPRGHCLVRAHSDLVPIRLLLALKGPIGSPPAPACRLSPCPSASLSWGPRTAVGAWCMTPWLASPRRAPCRAPASRLARSPHASE